MKKAVTFLNRVTVNILLFITYFTVFGIARFFYEMGKYSRAGESRDRKPSGIAKKAYYYSAY